MSKTYTQGTSRILISRIRHESSVGDAAIDIENRIHGYIQGMELKYPDDGMRPVNELCGLRKRKWNRRKKKNRPGYISVEQINNSLLARCGRKHRRSSGGKL